MDGVTELMLAAGVVGFLAGFVATAMFFCWAFFPIKDDEQ